MDLSGKTPSELLEMHAQIWDRIQEIQEEELKKKRIKNQERLEYLREHREVILSLVKHSRTSCSDDNPSNGYFDNGYARCNKCLLMDILDWNNDYEVNFEVTISELKQWTIK